MCSEGYSSIGVRSVCAAATTICLCSVAPDYYIAVPHHTVQILALHFGEVALLLLLLLLSLLLSTTTA
jgi:hypothetical protein